MRFHPSNAGAQSNGRLITMTRYAIYMLVAAAAALPIWYKIDLERNRKAFTELLSMTHDISDLMWSAQESPELSTPIFASLSVKLQELNKTGYVVEKYSDLIQDPDGRRYSAHISTTSRLLWWKVECMAPWDSISVIPSGQGRPITLAAKFKPDKPFIRRHLPFFESMMEEVLESPSWIQEPTQFHVTHMAKSESPSPGKDDVKTPKTVDEL